MKTKNFLEQITKNKDRFAKRQNVFVLCSLFFCLIVFAEPSEERKRLEDRVRSSMDMAGELLEKTHKNATRSESELHLLNEQISSRRALLNEILNEVNTISDEMVVVKKEIRQLEKERDALKENYALIVRQMYRQRTIQNKWLFILSGEDFSQIYHRFRYLRKISEQTLAKAAQIQELSNQLTARLEQIGRAKREKSELLRVQKQETQTLNVEQAKQAKLVDKLKKQEKQLIAAIEKQEKAIQGMNVKIQGLIEQENVKSEKQADAALQTEGGFAMTKDDKLVSDNFAKRKGRLPMPVERGVIVKHFGQHRHPAISRIVTNNKGIGIQAPASAEAKSVFEGVVTQTFSFPGYNNAVIVRHGNYRTIYSNLSAVYVKTGDKISARQPLGKIFTDKDADKTELYFLLYKEKELLNPELFLAK